MRRAAAAIEWIGPALALLLAVAIYMGWRTGLVLHTVHGFHGAALFKLPGWVRFSLPDALWQYAFAALVLWVWRDRPWTVRKSLWCCIPVALGVGVEFGQLFRMLPGTFDWRDLLLSGLATVVALLVHGRTHTPSSAATAHRRTARPTSAPSATSASSMPAARAQTAWPG